MESHASAEDNISPNLDDRVAYIGHSNHGYEENDEEAVQSVSSTPSNETCELEDEDESTLRAEGNHRLSTSIPMELVNNMKSIESDMFDMSKLERRPKAAVIVRNATKRYGNGPAVLKNFSMTVTKGSIYSLLGSSGCGKTTLLSCVVGIKHLNEGEISVFGASPGTVESGVPGKRVGYMPQEIALYNDFSIHEALRYFGNLYGMDSATVQSSEDFLIEFLDLPDRSQRIGTLSGGQKRRVSLAVSLVHSPELLILDEPTVGVDPLLRESIWNHLCKIVSSQETTVIITTHYIEEARQSSTIGLMRGGRLLAEKSPELLLREYNTNLLEDIVLKLCRNDHLGNQQEDVLPAEIEETEFNETKIELVEPYAKDRKSSHPASGKRRMSMLVLEKIYQTTPILDSYTRVTALAQKNCVVLARNIILLIFMLLAPLINVFVICIAVGNDPTNLDMGYINNEMNDTASCLLQPKMLTYGECKVEELSCQFLSKLPPNAIHLHEYPSEAAARDAVEGGKIWGFMVFPEGYSDSVYTRSAGGNIVDNETLEGSQVLCQLDQSNKQISASLKKYIYDAYKDFVKELLIDCGFHPELGETPVKYLDPVYGTDDTDFREYVAPSILLALLFFFPLCSSGISIIWDKKQGTMERARVAGVKTWEILASFFMTEGTILLLQCALGLFVISTLFGIQVHGSLPLAFALCFLVGLAGISFGFMISSFCEEEIEAVLLAMASFFPNFILAGMLWPIEGMPIFMQYIAYFLPCTLACETFRSIISRGWEFTHINVWPGFATTFAWICVYWTATIIVHRVVLSKK